MPYLRFSRTGRGYEHTYVLHTFRGAGESRPRLLYWFRTPPGVRVGRHPLDEDAIRAIEESNPGLSFDWSRMLKVQPPPPPDAARRGRTPRAAHGVRGAGPGRSDRSGRPAAAPEAAAAEAARRSEDAPAAEAAAETAETELLAELEADGQPPVWRHPVVTLMGDEMLERLRARYAEIQVRMAEKRIDAALRATLQQRAEALNPDGWTTVEDAVHGIERFEAEAEAIRSSLGRRRPRPRRPAGAAGDARE